MTHSEIEILAVVGEWTDLKETDVVEFEKHKITVDGCDPFRIPDCVAFGTVNGEPALIGFIDREDEDGYIIGESPYCYKKT